MTFQAGQTVTLKEGTFTPPEDVAYYRYDYVQELQLKLIGK